MQTENNEDKDDAISESAVESFRQGWYDAVNGNTLPVSQLWEEIHTE